jgi:nitroreductase
MVRRYTSEPVPPERLERILQAAPRAPSAGNAQGQSLVVVTDPDRRAALAEAAGEPGYVARGFDPWISTAPVLIAICVSPDRYRRRYSEPDKDDSDQSWTVPYWWVDGGATLMTLLLAAVDEGLAAGFLGAHAFTGLEDLLGVPEGVEILGVVTLGTAAPDRPTLSRGRSRLPRDEVIHLDRW